MMYKIGSTMNILGLLCIIKAEHTTVNGEYFYFRNLARNYQMFAES